MGFGKDSSSFGGFVGKGKPTQGKPSMVAMAKSRGTKSAKRVSGSSHMKKNDPRMS